MPTLATFIQHSIGNPSHHNQTRKRNKKYQKLEGKEVKQSLFTDGIIVYIENPKVYQKTIRTNKWVQ